MDVAILILIKLAFLELSPWFCLMCDNSWPNGPFYIRFFFYLPVILLEYASAVVIIVFIFIALDVTLELKFVGIISAGANSVFEYKIHVLPISLFSSQDSFYLIPVQEDSFTNRIGFSSSVDVMNIRISLYFSFFHEAFAFVSFMIVKSILIANSILKSILESSLYFQRHDSSRKTFASRFIKAVSMPIDFIIINEEIGINPVLICLFIRKLLMEPLDFIWKSGIVVFDSGQIRAHFIEKIEVLLKKSFWKKSSRNRSIIK